jgi:hypothetical protein
MTNEKHWQLIAKGWGLLISAFMATAPSGAALAAQAAWSAELVLTAPSASGSTQIHTASNASGVAAVVWDQRIDYSTSHLYAAINDGGWTAPRRLSVNPTLYSSMVGALVAEGGQVTVYWQEGATPYYSVYASGAWSPATVIPSDPAFNLVAGAGIDRSGNVQFLMVAPRLSGATRTYDAEALVKDSLGNWTAPTQLTTTPGAYPRLFMNSSGQAMVIAGYLSWRSAATGTWNPSPRAIPSMAGQTYATDAALDAAGNGYFVLYNRYGGMNISTCTPTSNWAALRHLTKFDVLGSSLAITGGGPGGALIYGVDYMTGKLRASVTTAAGKSWGALNSFGVVQTQAEAAGSETGLYAIAWDGKVSAGTGIGTRLLAWNTQVQAPNPYLGSVAMAANRAVAGWVRATDATLIDWVISASTGTIAP